MLAQPTRPFLGGEAITAGNTTPKASHINELRTQIENLRTDVDAGSGGVWSSGTGGAGFIRR